VPLFQEADKRGSRVKIPRGRATVKRFAILNLRFTIEKQSKIQKQKSKIVKARKPAYKYFAE
jgi:hypothetical protein